FGFRFCPLDFGGSFLPLCLRCGEPCLRLHFVEVAVCHLCGLRNAGAPLSGDTPAPDRLLRLDLFLRKRPRLKRNPASDCSHEPAGVLTGNCSAARAIGTADEYANLIVSKPE